MRELDVRREPCEFIKPSPIDNNNNSNNDDDDDDDDAPAAFYLHNIDQQVFFHVEVMFVYKVESSDATGDAVDRLKEGLSKVLASYSHIAGRLRVNEQQRRIELVCNAKGVPFAGAACSSSIHELGDLRQVHPQFRKLLLYPSNVQKIEDVPLLTVQVTRFKCGGVVVGMHVHHIALDGVSGGQFFNDFGRAARGLELENCCPTPDRSALRTRTPPKVTCQHPEMVELPDMPPKLLFNPASFDPDAPLPCAAKITRFSAAELEKLKSKALEDGVVNKCSTFEALAAHIWRAKLSAELDDDAAADDELARLFVATDVRSKLKKNALGSNFSGNAVIAAACFSCSKAQVCGSPLSFAVEKIQRAIRQVDEELIRSQLDWCEVHGHGIINVPGSVIVTAWNKLRFEQTDFGWGGASYILPAVNARSEYALLLPSCKNDGGVDVFIAIHAPKMAKLEALLKA